MFLLVDEVSSIAEWVHNILADRGTDPGVIIMRIYREGDIQLGRKRVNILTCDNEAPFILCVCGSWQYLGLGGCDLQQGV
jgi:hypothetical protein